MAASDEPNGAAQAGTHTGGLADAHWANRGERSSAWVMRLMTWLSLRLGRRGSRPLLWLIAAYFVLFAPAARRASRQYLDRVLGRRASWADVFRHVLTFAATIHDRVYLLNGRFDLFDIRLHGEAAIDAAIADTRATGEGVFLMGAHLGSFEVMRSIGRTHPDLQVAITMYAADAQRLQDVLGAINPAVKQDVIPLGTLDAMLQVRTYLARGFMVGVLADRSLPGRAAGPDHASHFLGSETAFPTGPMRMAAMLRRPVIFIAGLYRGGNRYDVVFEQIADFRNVARGEREAALRTAMTRYVDCIETHCRSTPFNWFNFFDFWETRPDPAQASASGTRPSGKTGTHS